MREGKVYVSRARRGLGRPEAYRLIRRAVLAALAEEGVDVPCEVNVLLADDAVLHELNLQHRGVDRPTDVLSFPLNDLRPGEFDAAQCECDPETGRCLLGDMALSLERCERQGEEFGHGFERELQYLAVHSTLHLLGYDHVDEGEMKRAMRAREKLVMQRLEAER